MIPVCLIRSREMTILWLVLDSRVDALGWSRCLRITSKGDSARWTLQGKVLLLGRDVGQFDSLVDVDTNESV